MSCRKVLGVLLSSGINSAKQAGKKEGGWREGIFARSCLPFLFRLRKEKAEGGFGVNSAFSLRNQIADSPATCLNTWRADHRRKILFSLEDKVNCEAREGALGQKEIGRAQNEKSKEYFSVVWRGWLPYWGFCSKKVRTSIKRTPPDLN